MPKLDAPVVPTSRKGGEKWGTRRVPMETGGMNDEGSTGLFLVAGFCGDVRSGFGGGDDREAGKREGKMANIVGGSAGHGPRHCAARTGQINAYRELPGAVGNS